MAALERLQRINDFHRIYPSIKCIKLELKARSYGSGCGKSSAIGASLRIQPPSIALCGRGRASGQLHNENGPFLPLLALSVLTACIVPIGPVEVTRFNRLAEAGPYGTGSFAVALAGESGWDLSPATQPGIAASKLAESLFKDFPGVSGETIRVP